MNNSMLYLFSAHLSWYGAAESRWFWDYIKIACKDFPNNCINSIESLANAKTARGKVTSTFITSRLYL